MAIIRRIFLFLAVNFLVVITISLILNVLGIGRYMTPYGLDYQALAGFCLVWGMVGALISLALSRVMAKFAMGVHVIDPGTHDPDEQALIQTVYGLARGARLPVMPQVGIYDSPEVNAFATGPSKSRSLVAVSTGLISRMRVQEVEGVLGHEIAHIANGDMVTMTLVQGVVNAFVMFLSRVIAFALTQAMRGNSDREERGGGFSHMTFYVTSMVLEIIFMILGSMVVAFFSRYREFRADTGGARLAGRQNMIAALQALQRTYELVDPSVQPAVASLKISSKGRGIFRLFSTHPPLEERIARLEAMAG